MSKYYINQNFYGISKGCVIECKLVKYDELNHVLYLRDLLGQAYKCSEYKIGLELFTLKVNAEKSIGIYKPKKVGPSVKVSIGDSTTFSWSGSGMHPDSYGLAGSKQMYRTLPQERVSAGWEDKRGRNIHKEDDWSIYDYKIKG